MQVPPFELVPIVAIFMGTLTVLIPVSLIALRFAIKPIAEAIAITRSASSLISAGCKSRCASLLSTITRPSLAKSPPTMASRERGAVWRSASSC